MKQRARVRGSSCDIFPEWENFLPFKLWSTSNGYSDNLILCRNGDVGNYEPNNCRWDTHKSNNQESRLKEGGKKY